MLLLCATDSPLTLHPPSISVTRRACVSEDDGPRLECLADAWNLACHCSDAQARETDVVPQNLLLHPAAAQPAEAVGHRERAGVWLRPGRTLAELWP